MTAQERQARAPQQGVVTALRYIVAHSEHSRAAGGTAGACSVHTVPSGGAAGVDWLLEGEAGEGEVRRSPGPHGVPQSTAQQRPVLAVYSLAQDWQAGESQQEAAISPAPPGPAPHRLQLGIPSLPLSVTVRNIYYLQKPM